MKKKQEHIIMSEEQKAKLRPLFKLGAREWIRLFVAKEITAEELKFLSSFQKKDKPKRQDNFSVQTSQDFIVEQTSLSPKCKDCEEKENLTNIKGELICSPCFDKRVNLFARKP